MSFGEMQERRFRTAWESIRIARGVECGLFTFGESELPYFLVSGPKADVNGPKADGGLVSIQRGEVKVTRPLIITPENARPELRDFFEEASERGFAEFMLSRTAAFSHLKFSNQKGPEKIVSDSVEEAVAKLNRQLDEAEEDRVAILTAPAGWGGLAAMRYAAERVISSAPDNIQELRERGFLP